MAVELDGTVKMRGNTGPGVAVRVVAGDRRLRIVSGNELIGDWEVANIGIAALQDGFSIKAEGEEFILNTKDDAALASELRIAAASPRLARQIAARQKPDEREPQSEPYVVSSNLAAIGFAVAGALIVLGGVFLNLLADAEPTLLRSVEESGTDFWLAFVIGGVLMIAAAFVMSIGTPGARVVALIVLVAVIGFFGWTVASTGAETGELTAYGFIAGGVVVGVAVLVSSSLRSQED